MSCCSKMVRSFNWRKILNFILTTFSLLILGEHTLLNTFSFWKSFDVCLALAIFCTLFLEMKSVLSSKGDFYLIHLALSFDSYIYSLKPWLFSLFKTFKDQNSNSSINCLKLLQSCYSIIESMNSFGKDDIGNFLFPRYM